MKKILWLLMIILCASCTKNNEPEQGVVKEIANIVSVLNGKFSGSLYSSVTNTTETEEISFSSYSTPQKIVSIIDGEVIIYGTVLIDKYYNDHLLEVKKNCYYSINIAYEGAQPIISFYQYGTNGEISDKEDKRIISIVSNSSFKMTNYGSSIENAKTYNK